MRDQLYHEERKNETLELYLFLKFVREAKDIHHASAITIFHNYQQHVIFYIASVVFYLVLFRVMLTRERERERGTNARFDLQKTENSRTISVERGIFLMISISLCSFLVSAVFSIGMNLTATISIVLLLRHEHTVPNALCLFVGTRRKESNWEREQKEHI